MNDVIFILALNECHSMTDRDMISLWLEGAAEVWINIMPCKAGIAGSIPSFSSLLNETLSCGLVPIRASLLMG